MNIKVAPKKAVILNESNLRNPRLFKPQKKPNIRVHNSWLRGTLVEIEVEGSRYTVDGNEIKRAVDNCMNV